MQSKCTQIRRRAKLMTRLTVFAAVMGTALAGAAHASTIADFTWVDNSGTGSGTLVLTLPGTITSNTFSSGGLTTAQALADLTSLTYTFSDGITVTSSNFNTGENFTGASGTITSGIAWATTSSGHAGYGAGTTDLITGFKFTGNQTLGVAGPSSYQLASPLSLAGNEAVSSNNITPTHGTANVDTGYWELTSLTPAPVPLPAALPLLLSGLGLFGAASRRRRGL